MDYSFPNRFDYLKFHWDACKSVKRLNNSEASCLKTATSIQVVLIAGYPITELLGSNELITRPITPMTELAPIFRCPVAPLLPYV